jgi:preprotein translocase subunit SecB
MSPEPNETAAPPEYDRDAVARVAQRVQIRSIELVQAHFERSDDEPLPGAVASDSPPEIAIDYDWQLAPAEPLLGCVLRFAAIRKEDDAPGYSIYADFRLLYDTRGDEELDGADANQFVLWNAVFNAWPYWREYVSSVVNRAGLPRFSVPLYPHPTLAEQTGIESQPLQVDV